MKRTYSEHNSEKQQPQQQRKHSQKQHNDANPTTGDNSANPPKKTNSWADMGKTARKTAKQRIEERSAAADYGSSPVTTKEPHAQDMEGDQDHSGQIETSDPAKGSESAGDTNISDMKALIRALNDKLRTTCEGGIILMTEGITSLEPEMLNQCMMKIQGEQVFNEDNDPYGEHDFGSVKHEDIVVFWKIDYYDLDMLHHSPDPSDEHVTKRVLTIMLASEY